MNEMRAIYSHTAILGRENVFINNSVGKNRYITTLLLFLFLIQCTEFVFIALDISHWCFNICHM